MIRQLKKSFGKYHSLLLASHQYYLIIKSFLILQFMDKCETSVAFSTCCCSTSCWVIPI